jgi:sugar lactone lactonase YvrE
VAFSPSHIAAVHPARAIEGGRVTIIGGSFATGAPHLPEVRIDNRPARVVSASPSSLTALVPAGITESGRVPVRVEGVSDETAFIQVAAPFATGLHQVDNPIFDRDGNLFVTYSGTRGQQVPVSIFRVRPDGTRETFSSAVVNPTSMAVDPDGRLYVSSRFEGVVYRLESDGTAVPFATDLGIASGLIFAPDGTLLVGDRSGTIFKVDRAGRASAFVTLPPSVAAFHLALGQDGTLFVSGPTLSSYDCVYQIDPLGAVAVRPERFGRPQGIALDPGGALFVVEALAGVSGLYRLRTGGEPELVVAGPGLVGVAFDSRGSLVVCSKDTAYRLSPTPSGTA